MNIEYIKLIASFITPVVILLLGIWAKGLATNHEKRLSLNNRIIEKRVEVYEEIGVKLNDIYAFTIQVGDWKEFHPEKIILKKRELDKQMFVSRPYWSNTTFNAYQAFIGSCFDLYNGVGLDARVKASTAQFKQLDSWETEMVKYFSESGQVDRSKTIKAYADLIKAFSSDFGYIQD